jgi:probable rRNA maturation factor
VFTLQLACKAAAIPSRRKLRAWAQAALARDARVTLRIVDGHEGRSLNRRFRGRDYATNVLTFVYQDRSGLAGDIALCAPVIEREARAGAIALDAHYAHLVVHGMLHLQGYDHVASRDAKAMETHERAILKRLGYPDPYRRMH